MFYESPVQSLELKVSGNYDLALLISQANFELIFVMLYGCAAGNDPIIAVPLTGFHESIALVGIVVCDFVSDDLLAIYGRNKAYPRIESEGPSGSVPESRIHE